MAAAIEVRGDYTLADLRVFSRRCGDADQVRRLLAVALILDGGSRSEAAKIAGVTLQIVRDWVLRFNAGGPEGLVTRRAPGRSSILNDMPRAQLAEIVEAGPIPAAHGVVRWRLADLAQWIWDEFELSVTRHTLGRELRAMGYRKLSARPRHRGQKSGDIADFKKFRRPSGAGRAAAPKGNTHRVVVARRGTDRPADQTHPALSQARNPTISTQGPAPLLGMDLWRDLSR